MRWVQERLIYTVEKIQEGYNTSDRYFKKMPWVHEGNKSESDLIKHIKKQKLSEAARC